MPGRVSGNDFRFSFLISVETFLYGSLLSHRNKDIFCSDLLCILTSQPMLRTPFAGRDHLFQCFTIFYHPKPKKAQKSNSRKMVFESHDMKQQQHHASGGGAFMKRGLRTTIMVPGESILSSISITVQAFAKDLHDKMKMKHQSAARNTQLGSSTIPNFVCTISNLI